VGPSEVLKLTARGKVGEAVGYREGTGMDTVMTLLIGVTIGLGLMALGLGGFVLGTPAARSRDEERNFRTND
jgi:hypothetical protein